VTSSDAPTLANTVTIATGSTVNAIFLRVEVLAVAGFVSVPRIYMAVMKNPGGTTDVQIPRTMFQGVIRIPPRLKRFGVRDELNVLFQQDTAETTGITNVCVQCIYKEFR